MPNAEQVRARVWIGETKDYTFRYTAPYPMDENEVRKRLNIPKNETLTPKADRRMTHNGLWRVKGRRKRA